jgi:hypothetical protein
MLSIEEELLQHQYIYVPWVQEKPIYETVQPGCQMRRKPALARGTAN